MPLSPFFSDLQAHRSPARRSSLTRHITPLAVIVGFILKKLLDKIICHT